MPSSSRWRRPGCRSEQRNRAILIGIAAATVLRIVFALTTTQLLLLGPGLLVGGGLLLLWVCWKMWRELRTTAAESHAADEALADRDLDASGDIAEGAPRKTFAQAAWQIVIADVSMSLDNVLAVAGAALEHPFVLIFGLVLSIALMGVAATFIARLLQRHRWIAYVGLLIIFYVALKMIWEGGWGWRRNWQQSSLLRPWQAEPRISGCRQACLGGPFNAP